MVSVVVPIHRTIPCSLAQLPGRGLPYCHIRNGKRPTGRNRCNCCGIGSCYPAVNCTTVTALVRRRVVGTPTHAQEIELTSQGVATSAFGGSRCRRPPGAWAAALTTEIVRWVRWV